MEAATLLDSLSVYYGLDWLSMLFGFIGLYLTGNKNRLGFLFTGVSLCFAFVIAIKAQQYGFVAANLVSAVLVARAYSIWGEVKFEMLPVEVGNVSFPQTVPIANEVESTQ